MFDGYKAPFGYLHCSFIEAMTWPSCWEINHQKRRLTSIGLKSFEDRTRAIKNTLELAYEEGKIPSMRKRANEALAVYAPDREHVLDMEVLAVDSFGIVASSVHLITYVITAEGRKYWIQRRAKDKPTFPGMLDSTAAGNLISTEEPLDGMVRENEEEAGIPQCYTRANIKACATVSYQMSKCNDGRPGSLPHLQYNYELELPQRIVPFSTDGEVDEFMLLSLDELCDALTRGDFKPNITMTYVAYLVRHEYINISNEQNLAEVCARLNRKHDLFIAEKL